MSKPILRVFGYAPAPTVPTPTSSAAPVLGTQIVLNVQGAPAGVPAFLFFAFSNTTWLGQPLPFDLAPLGAPDCFNYTSADNNQLLITGAGGSASLSLSIPASPTLTGFVFYNQAAVAGASNPLGFLVTNAGKAHLGT